MPIDAITDTLGDVYVTGSTQSDLYGTNKGYSDVFLAKFDGDGNVLWGKQYGSNLYDEGESLAFDECEHLFLSGITGGDIDSNSKTGGSLFLMRIDIQGDRVWTVQHPGNNDGQALYHSSLGVDAEGYLYVAGMNIGDLNGMPNAGGRDVYLGKFTEEGINLFYKQYGTDCSDGGEALVVQSNGTSFISGYSDCDLDGKTNAGNGDVFLSKFIPAAFPEYEKFALAPTWTAYDESRQAVCARLFGNAYVLADWNQTQDYYAEGGSLSALRDGLQLETYRDSWVSVGRAPLGEDQSYGYFLSYDGMDSSYAIDDIASHYFDLGKSNGSNVVLCHEIETQSCSQSELDASFDAGVKYVLDYPSEYNLTTVRIYSESDIDRLTAGQWYLEGSRSGMADLSIFDGVRLVWMYDGGWKVYSGQAAIRAMEDYANYEEITSIPAHKGFWIKK